MDSTLRIVGRIKAYLPNAMQDDFEDGEFASYDATEIVVIEPDDLKGTTLTFYHDRDLDEQSPWREVDGLVVLSAARDIFDYETMFSGTVGITRSAEPVGLQGH